MCVCVQNCSSLVGINSWGVTVVPWDAQHSAALPEAPMCEQCERDLSIVQAWMCFSCLSESEGSACLYVGQPGASEINDLTREEFAPVGVCLDLELSSETSLSPGASRSCCSSFGHQCLSPGVPAPKARATVVPATCQGSQGLCSKGWWCQDPPKTAPVLTPQRWAEHWRSSVQQWSCSWGLSLPCRSFGHCGG